MIILMKRVLRSIGWMALGAVLEVNVILGVVTRVRRFV